VLLTFCIDSFDQGTLHIYCCFGGLGDDPPIEEQASVR
jgi:hypothetical protein